MGQNGGKREGAGRKPKADEERIKALSIKGLVSMFGSEERAFESLAQQAATSFPHMKLLFEYAYGKPKESLEITDHSMSVELSDEVKDLFGKASSGTKDNT